MEHKKSNWQRLTAEETLRQLGSQADGLSGKEAGVRLRRNGCNTLFDLPKRKDPVIRKLLTDSSLWLFMAVALLAAGFAEPWSAVPALLLLGVWLGIVILQSVRVSRGMELLGRCGIPTVTVLRNRKLLRISARNVVVGDVLLLQRGDVVAGDCRLLSSSELQVRFLDCKVEQLNCKKTVLQRKKADVVYPYQAETSAPDYENLIYAGSEIEQGTARAVVFAVGADTFAGSLGVAFRRDGFEREPKQISRFLPFFRFFGLVSLILLFPIGIMGLLIAPKEQSGMRVFLPICAWIATSAWGLPYCYLRGIVHRGVRSSFRKNAKANGALIQSAKAIDTLPHLTDLFLLGRGAISDGRLHFHAAFTGEGVCLPEEKHSARLQTLCESFCLLEDALARFPRHLIPTSERAEPYLAELIDSAEFDRESLAVRVSKTELYRGKTERILDVESNGGAFRLRYYYDTMPSMLSVGEYLTGEGVGRTLDAEKRKAYEAFLRRALRSGCSVVTVLKEFRGVTRFVGCLARREAFLRDLSGACGELEQAGVRVRLFLDRETEENAAYAASCMPNRSAWRATENADPSAASEADRVFFGYSDERIANYVKRLRKQGGTVGVITCESDYRSTVAAASLVIGGDRDSSNEGESDCDPILQRDSDVLVAGASSSGGGLSAVGQALRTFRQTEANAELFYERFLQSRLTLSAFMILSVVLGMGSLPAYAVLYSALIVDLLFLITPQKEIRSECGRYDPEGFLTDPNAWTRTLLPPMLATLATAVFYRFELISSSDGYAVMLVSLLLMQTLKFVLGEHRCRLDVKAVRSLLILWLPALAIIALSAFIPAVSALTDLGEWNQYSVIVLLLGLLSELLARLLPRKKRR